LVSEALSPGAQPGKPPLGCHSPLVVVQFIGPAGGALAVTLYDEGTQTAMASPAAAKSRASSRVVDTAAVMAMRRISGSCLRSWDRTDSTSVRAAWISYY
jgi:hypothetical protein